MAEEFCSKEDLEELDKIIANEKNISDDDSHLSTYIFILRLIGGSLPKSGNMGLRRSHDGSEFHCFEEMRSNFECACWDNGISEKEIIPSKLFAQYVIGNSKS